MAEQIGSGTAQGLIEYLDQLVEKGRATSGGIVPLKSTIRKVLSKIDGEENWKNTDIRSVDTGDYISRFKNLTLGKYNKDSYVVYLSRLNKVKEWYLTFLQDPGWAPTIKGNGKQLKKRKDDGDSKNTTEVLIKPEKQKTDSSGQQSVNDSVKKDLVSYPFPIRAGKMAYLYLPIDLTSIEAKRLSKFIDSLSIDGEE